MYRRQTEKNPDVIPLAITEYEKAAALDPGNIDVWWDLGLMYKQDHQNEKAIDAFQKYLDRNKGKDASGQKRAEDEIGALGGTVGGDKKPKTKATPNKPAPKKPAPNK